MSHASPSSSDKPHRRRFLKDATALAAVGAAGATLVNPRMVHAAGSDVIKYALIGCGGRGMGAAMDAAKSGDNMQLVALADVFKDRATYAQGALKQQLGSKFNVADDRVFHDFDSYKQVMASDCDLVLLCTTPHFRPTHLRAAIEAGKHVFCEKPVAVDAPGVRHVLETTKLAGEKKLNLVSGLCWRYDFGVRETMKRIKDGAIGEVLSIQENYLTGTLWHREPQPGQKWSDMETQIRNWLYYTWLSGDHNVEQHIHSLDKALWLMNDEPPTLCYGLGGRQVRTESKWGHIYDHFAVVYEWANGVKCHAYTRQMDGCFNETEDFVQGTKGTARILQNTVSGQENWKYSGPKPNMYQVEHQELNSAISEGRVINNGTYMCYSTMMAIIGRMACYTGQKLTWQQAMASTESLTPSEYSWGPVQLPPEATAVAMPGRTKFV